MSWKMAGHEWPKEGQLILVFRSKRKKYVAAYLNVFMDEELHYERELWVTQHGIAHDVEACDAWIEFEYYKTEQEWK